MIVGCERCSTQFQLDDARVPAEGVRVRCSRCKHAFVVQPVGAAPTEEEAVHAIAENAAESGGVPDIAQDTGEAYGSEPEIGASEPAGDPALDEGDDEPVWEFGEGSGDLGGPDEEELQQAEDALEASSSDEDVFGGVLGDEPDLESEASLDLATEPQPADDGADLAGPDVLAGSDVSLEGEASAAATPILAAEDLGAELEPEFPIETAAPEPESASDELGSPADWDLLDDPKPAAPPAAVQAPKRPEDEWIQRRPEPVPEPDLEQIDMGAARLRQAGSAVGWLVTAGLCALGFLHGLAPRPLVSELQAPVGAGLEFQEVEGRWVDHLSEGNLFVVTGRLHNASDASQPLPALELVWRNRAGEPTGNPVPLATPRPLESLREAPIGEGELPQPAVSSLAPGAAWGFEGRVAGLPYEVDHFLIQVQR